MTREDQRTAAAHSTAAKPTPHTLNNLDGPAITPLNQTPRTELFSRRNAPLTSERVSAASPAAENIDAASATTESVNVASVVGGAPGGDNSDEQAQRDAEETIQAYDQVRAILQQVRGLREDLVGERERIDSMIARVDAQVADVEALLAAGPRQEPGRAFELVAGQAALADDVDTQAEAQDTEKPLWRRIMDWMGTANKKLWALISRTTRVKEWTLSGKVGGGLLGFGEASITVTFA